MKRKKESADTTTEKKSAVKKFNLFQLIPV